MAVEAERWTRGSGNGIGPSSHKNQYRLGVCIDNWQEDGALQQNYIDTGSLRGRPGKFDGTTVSRNSFTPKGKYGPGIAVNRLDKEPIHDGLRADQLFPHTRDPHESNMVTMSQLTLGHPSRGDPRVNQLMWTGSKHVDSKVPTGPLQGAMAALGASYQEKVHKEQTYAIYRSTSKEMTEATATMASGMVTKRQIALPQSDGGQRPQIGRKASGEFVKGLEAPHLTVGLRK